MLAAWGHYRTRTFAQKKRLRYSADMAGHNKWTQIKRKKGVNDSAKSAVFGKFARRITVEAKLANGDMSASNLSAIIERARKADMPKDAIERAVAKATTTEAGALEQITYETYGPGGAAIIIEALTDSKNRTSAEIKHLLSKNELALATPGSAMWAFDPIRDASRSNGAGKYEPKILIKLSPEDNAKLMKVLEEIDAYDDVEDVYTNAE